MSRRAFRSFVFAFAFVPLALLPRLTSAQAGAVINKARQAASDAANTKPMGSNAAIGDPFDAAGLESALKGLRAFKAKMSEVASLTTQYLDVQKRRSALEDANGKQIEAFNQSDRKIEDCISQGVNNKSPAQQQQMQQGMMAKMSDPKFATEYSRLAQASASAAMAKDTAAQRKLAMDMMKLMGVDPKADTAAAAAKCGARPARPAAVAQIEQLQKQADDLNQRIRSTESSADIEAARAAGVTPVRFAQMRERLLMYTNDPKAFGGKEGDLLKPRKAEIEGLIKTP